jgi:hypothetical protein
MVFGQMGVGRVSNPPERRTQPESESSKHCQETPESHLRKQALS